MVKHIQTKDDHDLSTSHSLCSETYIFPSETLSNIIDKMPKLTPQERRQAMRISHSPSTNSRKWSQS